MFCAAEVLGDKRSVFFLNAAAFRSQASSAQDCSNEPGVVWSFQVVWEWWKHFRKGKRWENGWNPLNWNNSQLQCQISKGRRIGCQILWGRRTRYQILEFLEGSICGRWVRRSGERPIGWGALGLRWAVQEFSLLPPKGCVVALGRQIVFAALSKKKKQCSKEYPWRGDGAVWPNCEGDQGDKSKLLPCGVGPWKKMLE